MNTRKVTKMALLNMGIAIFDITTFSPGLLGVSLSSANIASVAFGYTSLVMSCILFIYGNYKLLTKETNKLVADIETFNSIHDCIDSLRDLESKDPFVDKIETLVNQLKRLEKKIDTLQDLVNQKFTVGEMTNSKFTGVLEGVENVILINVKNIINKVNTFDQKEYSLIVSKRFGLHISDSLKQTKLDIYKGYIEYVDNSLKGNEEILVKLDLLLLEISGLNSSDSSDLVNTDELKELEDLTAKTKLYV